MKLLEMENQLLIDVLARYILVDAAYACQFLRYCFGPW